MTETIKQMMPAAGWRVTVEVLKLTQLPASTPQVNSGLAPTLAESQVLSAA
jgi:hypothetical protein